MGGKTAVNHPAGKNLIGAFHQPRLVVIDPAVLDTLPARELRSGLAEMICTAWCWTVPTTLLEQRMPELLRRDREAMTAAIVGSCALKAAVVAADEREAGRRAPLNYGHLWARPGGGHSLHALHVRGERWPSAWRWLPAWPCS